MNQNRIVFVDYLRAIACLMVITVHACEFFYFDADGNIYIANETNRLCVSFIDGGLRACVPLFVMASSYLLLPLKEQLSTGDFLKKRFLRVLIPFLIWAFLYAVLPMAWGDFTWSQSVEQMYTYLTNFPSNAGHLWFVYMLIGVYLFMPIISPWMRKVGQKEELFFLGVWFVSTFWHFIQQLSPNHMIYGEAFWNEFTALYYCSGFFGYILMAHYIRTYIHWNLRTTLWIAIPLLIVGYIITTTSFYYISFDHTDPVFTEITWRFCTPNVAIMTFALFVLIKQIKLNEGWFYRVILDLSRMSYGMYLVHIFLLNATYRVYSLYFNTLETICLTAISTYVLSYAVIKLLSYLPGSYYFAGCDRAFLKSPKKN